MISLEGISRVLIVKPSALGDIVHTLPFLASLKRTRPDINVQWVVAKGLHPILEGHPLIEKLWVIDKAQWKNIARIGSTVRELRSLFSDLKAEGFDLAVDLQGLLRSGLITRGSGAPVRVGFKEAREGSTLFYTHKVEGGISGDVHAIDRYLRVAAALGCDTSKVEYLFPPLPDSLSFDLPEEYAVIVPSAGKEANRWSAESFGEVAAGLSIPSVVIGTPSDTSIAEEVIQHSGGKAISLAGKTSIPEMTALIAKARTMVCNDTGPMHIAAAFGIPVVAIFGPANPARTGPYGEGHTVIREDLPCSPCYAKKPCKNPVCLTNITAERVLEAVMEKLK